MNLTTYKIMNLLYSLPIDIQQVIWKKYWSNNVILELKQQQEIIYVRMNVSNSEK